jgi:hypothetical protein
MENPKWEAPRSIRLSEELVEQLKDKAEQLKRVLPGVRITMGDVVRQLIIKGLAASDDR